ncbi:unnamed protein product [Phyllotreta striolata]|uniref:ADP-ribosylation factor-like protein 2-binding protein n=1 Tax=Phyllotreta striolata TaxID=444603 RepID=A0A9N9TF72_PHYSR|nr:unnamed protein product [Phyllotreta striolata]
MSDLLHSEDINDFDESTDANDRKFAVIIGHIEELMVNEAFKRFVDDFFDRVRVTPENEKEIHVKYSETVRGYVEDEIKERLANFDMNKFYEDLHARKNDVEFDVYEIISSFKDFDTFKNVYYGYFRDGKDKVKSDDLSANAISIVSYQNS